MFFRRGNFWRGQTGDGNGGDPLGGISCKDAAVSCGTERYRAVVHGEKRLSLRQNESPEDRSAKDDELCGILDQTLRGTGRVVAVFPKIFARFVCGRYRSDFSVCLLQQSR